MSRHGIVNFLLLWDSAKTRKQKQTRLKERKKKKEYTSRRNYTYWRESICQSVVGECQRFNESVRNIFIFESISVMKENTTLNKRECDQVRETVN